MTQTGHQHKGLWREAILGQLAVSEVALTLSAAPLTVEELDRRCGQSRAWWGQKNKVIAHTVAACVPSFLTQGVDSTEK